MGNKRWYWIVAISLFLVMMVNCGVGYYSLSLFVTPITKEFGISSGDFAVLYIFYGLGSAVAAAMLHGLIKRFSIKPLILLGGAISTAGYLLFAVSASFAHMFVGGLLIGASTVFAGTATVQMMIARWFYERRSQVTGIVAAASGIGTAIGGPMIGKVIRVLGWRQAFGIIGVLVLLFVCVQVIPLLREKPEDSGLCAYGAGSKADTTAMEGMMDQGYTLKEGMKKAVFPLFAGGMIVVAVVYQIISLYQSTMLIERGFSEETAALCLSIFAITDMCCKASAGIIADKKGFRIVTIYCAAATALAFVAVRMFDGMLGALLFSVLLGFWPTMCVLYGVTASISIFGKKHLSEYIGFTQTLMCCCSLVGMPLVRRLYNAVGSFDSIMNIAIGLLVLFAAMMLVMLRPKNLLRAN